MATLRVTNLKGRTGNVAPDLPDGANITGVCTATTFVGALTGNAGGLTGSPDIAVGQVTAGVTTFSDGGTSLATFNSTAASGPLINIKRSGTNIGFLGSGKNLHDSTGSADALGLRSQAEFTVATGGDSEKLRIDTSGRVLIGHTANIGGSKLQTNTTGASAFESTSWYNGADATGVSIRKSRGSTPGDYTVVQDGDGLGSLNFAGADGTDWANGARIKATVNGTPGSNDMPTKLEFFVSDDGTENLTERLEINSSGITVAGTVSDSKGTLRSLPVNSQTSAYSLVAADAGKMIKITTGGVTCPNGQSFAAGDMISIMNESGSAQTITQGGGATLYWTADGTTGNRTLGARGVATIVMAGSSAFYISGSGLT